MTSFRKQHFLIFLASFCCFSLLTTSCDLKQHKISNPRKVAIEKDTLQLVNHSGIGFEVDLGEATVMGTEIHCSVYNKSKKPVHYLTETCFSLEPFLRFDLETIRSVTKWDCVANKVEIKTLNPGDTIFFDAVIFDLEHNSAPKRIGLDFRTVNKNVGVKDLQKNKPVIYPEDYEEKELEKNRQAMEQLNNAPTRENDVLWINFPTK